MVDVSSFGTPTKDLVVALGTVNGRLRVDGQVAQRVQLNEVVADGPRFQSQGLITPGQGQSLAVTVLDEEFTDILEAVGRSPVLDSFVGLVLEIHAISIQVAKGGRAGVAPASVGELVPVIRATDVTLGTVGPEDGADTLFLALLVEALLDRDRKIAKSINTWQVSFCLWVFFVLCSQDSKVKSSLPSAMACSS